MTVKNISSKIINVGQHTLMPDQEVSLSEKESTMLKDVEKEKKRVTNPALLALESMKLISISGYKPEDNEQTVAKAAKKAKKSSTASALEAATEAAAQDLATA